MTSRVAGPGADTGARAQQPKRGRKRLAFFTNEFPGKVSTFVSRDIRALIDNDFDVDVFTLYPHDPAAWAYVPSLLSEDVLPREQVHSLSLGASLGGSFPTRFRDAAIELHDGIQIASAALIHGPERVAKSMYALPRAWTWAKRYRNHYDHVLAYWGNYVATCAYAFHRLAGDNIPFSMFLHAGMDLYEYRVFMRTKLLHCDNIFTVCEFNREFLFREYPDLVEQIRDKVHIHHLGLPLDELHYRPDGRPPHRLLAVGRLAEQKGYDVLLHAIARLKQNGIAVTLDLIGEGELEVALRQLASKLDIDDRVAFCGWKTFDEVQRQMTETTALVQPSVGLGDAVPTVIKEALALGTPVIGSDIVGIPELLDHGRCGVLVPESDASALAAAIETLLADPSRRLELAERGRQFAEKSFDMWENGRSLAKRLHASRRRDCP